jgi:transcriptional regulator with XRE-family HTH domain
MSASLGEKLRRAREERGISISEVAEQTRISPLYLKSIEADDYKPLPGGIFNKGFVRSYARYIGFDESEALADYAELMATNDVSPDIDQHVHHSEVWTDDNSMRSMGPTIIFADVILSLLAGGSVLLVKFLSGPSEPHTAMANANTSQSNAAGANSNLLGTAPIVPTGTTPAAAFSVELKANDERVWVGYTLDGNKTEKTLDPGESVKLDVQDSLKIGYAKVKAQSLAISINGKPIKVLGGGAKGNFDFDISRNNVGQILQSGELGTAPPVQRPAPAATSRPSPKPSASPVASPRPPTPNANAARRPPQ